MKVVLTRTMCNAVQTLGIVRGYNDNNIEVFSSVSLELAWKDNRKMISCIPSGLYNCYLENHRKFGWCYRIIAVAGRDGVLIHSGNYHFDIKGCILLGLGIKELNKDNQLDIIDSKLAMSLFVACMGKSFTLEIKNNG